MPAPLVLLESLFDYAGLFPPARLSMLDAVSNHAAYIHGPHASCLGRFIVPVARLAEFEAAYSQRPSDGQRNWDLAVIIGTDPAADATAVTSFNSRHKSVRIAAVETKAAQVGEIGNITGSFGPTFEIWVEIPSNGEPAPLLKAIKAAKCGVKVRLGGVTPGAFPPAEEVARFLVSCHQAGVVCKATAGLHHPFRGEYPLTYEPGSPSAVMFGFLNVVLAATLLQAGGDLIDATSLLTESAPQSFRVSDGAIGWRQYSLSSAQIAAARHNLCRSIGSCSFTEPVDGLLALCWL